jgi:hypothetical protein
MNKFVYSLLAISFALIPACEKQDAANGINPDTPVAKSQPVLDSPEAIADELANLQIQLAAITASIKDAPCAEKAIEEVAPVVECFAPIGIIIETQNVIPQMTLSQPALEQSTSRVFGFRCHWVEELLTQSKFY